MFPLSPRLTSSWPPYLTLAFFFLSSEWLSRFILWGRSTLRVWLSARYRRRIARAGKSGSGINMSVRNCLHPVTFWGAYCVSWVVLVVCVCMMIEGGFHPGPLVKVSGGDTTAAHVRLIPPPFPVRASVPRPP
jgi:hypothetical protein